MNKKAHITHLLVFIFSSFVFALPTSAQTELNASDQQGDRILLQYTPDLKEQLVEQLNQSGAVIRHDFEEMNVLAVTMPDTQTRSAMKMAGVMAVESDGWVRPLSQRIPWNITATGADYAWGYATGAGVRVCIIDTGIDRTHEDIGYLNILGGYDGVPNEAWYDDILQHGTMVASTINGLNNNVGFVGAAHGVTELLIADIFPNDGSLASESDILQAANWCATNGANIINMSLGGNTGGSRFIANGYQTLYNNGVLMVAAAGNNGVSSNSTDNYLYPASYYHVISVAGVREDLSHRPDSQENSVVEVSAPGTAIDVAVSEREILTLSDDTLYTPNVMYNADIAGSHTGVLVDGGTCNSAVPAGTYSGNIVICERGTELFITKIQNVEAGGGIAAIIYNSAAGSQNPDGNFYGTYGDCCATIPSVTMARTTGQTLLTYVGTSATIFIGGNDYSRASGTSFSSPMVAGEAALLWSACPSLTNDQVRAHISYFVDDFGSAGRDEMFGWGFTRIDNAMVGLFDGSNTYRTSNADGNTPANVECPTLPPMTPTAIPTNTPIPPTATPIPPTAIPTNTPIPPTAIPTNTPIPPTAIPTNTPIPPTTIPTNTPIPPTTVPVVPTSTPIAPTAVPVVPTNTPIAPTAIPVVPTNTPIPPMATPSIAVFHNNLDMWTTDIAGTDSATGGMWQYGDPELTGKQSDTGYVGTEGLFTGLNGGNDDGEFDVDNGETSVQSPFIVLPIGTDITLEFAYYFAYENSTPDDSFYVELVTSLGTTVLLEEVAQPDVVQDSVWKTAVFSLSDYAGESIYLRAVATDEGRGSLVEAGIDEVRITAESNPNALIPTSVDLAQQANIPLATFQMMIIMIGVSSLGVMTGLVRIRS